MKKDFRKPRSFFCLMCILVCCTSGCHREQRTKDAPQSQTPSHLAETGVRNSEPPRQEVSSKDTLGQVKIPVLRNWEWQRNDTTGPISSVSQTKDLGSSSLSLRLERSTPLPGKPYVDSGLGIKKMVDTELQQLSRMSSDSSIDLRILEARITTFKGRPAYYVHERHHLAGNLVESQTLTFIVDQHRYDARLVLSGSDITDDAKKQGRSSWETYLRGVRIAS